MVVPVSSSIAFSMGITMKVAFTVGRFQPPTTGHKVLIDRIVSEAGGPGDKAYVFVSNAKGKTNPLTAAEKIPFLMKMFQPSVASGKLHFVNTEDCEQEPPCGGPPAAYAWLRKKYPDAEFVLVAGSDRESSFGPNAGMWKAGISKEIPVPAPKFEGIKRQEGDKTSSQDPSLMSGTKARGFVKADDKASFSGAVKFGAMEDSDVDALFKLLSTRTAMFGGGDDIDENNVAWDADSEPKQAGRRRTYRKCRKCGLPVKPKTT
jgi:hypothetical protein